MWDECIEVPHATKSVWDESHTVLAPMPTPFKLINYFIGACFVVRTYKKWTLETKFQQLVAETHLSFPAPVMTEQTAVTADCVAFVRFVISATTTAT